MKKKKKKKGTQEALGKYEVFHPEAEFLSADR